MRASSVPDGTLKEHFDDSVMMFRRRERHTIRDRRLRQHRNGESQNEHRYAQNITHEISLMSPKKNPAIHKHERGDVGQEDSWVRPAQTLELP
jgi:hypothetical protein